MRKILSAFLVALTLLYTFPLRAGELLDHDKEANGYQFIDPNLKTPFFKPIPKDLVERLGKDYMLVRKDVVKEMDYRFSENIKLHETISEMTKDVAQRIVREEQLDGQLKESYAHIDLLNEHITAQERMIKDLQPTLWDKHKFGAGIVIGVIISGVAVFAAEELVKQSK